MNATKDKGVSVMDTPMPSERPAAILVVDDDPLLRGLFVATLVRDGYLVTGAENGEAALAVLEQETPDLLLVDIRMPKMDGPALYAQISHRWPELLDKIIFMTGDTVDPCIKEFLHENRCSVLYKPFSPSELSQQVRQFLASLPNEG